MKFVYEYRTSDNVIHRGEVNASDRDAAFKALRRSGIRPARLEESAGVLNKLFGKGKRWMAIGGLVIISLLLAFLWWRAKEDAAAIESSTLVSARHQVYGEPVFMDEMETSGFTNVFSNAVDCFLARFAQPGAIPKGLTYTWRQDFSTACQNIEEGYVDIEQDDRREIREIKQIVNGMRDELRRYLANGNGTPASYARRLEERQAREFQIYMNVKKELEKEDRHEEWQRRNEELRALGIMTIPIKPPAD